MDIEHNPDEPFVVESKREVPIKRVLPPDLPMIYSDGMVIQHKDGMFILYFLQSRYPLAVTPNELESIEFIESHCVAQIVLTPQQMERNIRAMGMNFEKFLNKLQENIGDKENI